MASVPIQLKDKISVGSRSSKEHIVNDRDHLKDIGSEEENEYLVHDESDLQIVNDDHKDDTDDDKVSVESVKEMLVSIHEYDEFDNDDNASTAVNIDQDTEMAKMWNEETEQIEKK
eukprot:CAMPEP_0201571012 /NCGR_PEP_ID=MMETSP0190_2-20130828/13562_1 /ASSEMBLY_ACC=CAM_ASM_000263 /TAXON_ID=37353 /ORGANISM="Rosalina sp." /LENGTH=115 /DNA_ID=CAMNT_0047995223 /DNA_START=108 /DNA_END=455 /DNA_ORIENTATION=-